MKIDTFELTNRTVKELRWNTNDINDIKRAEKAKSKLENLGFNLKFEKCGFSTALMGYEKANA